VPEVASRAFISGIDRDFSTSYAVYQARNAQMIALFDGIEHPNLYRVRPEEVFCDTFRPGRCATIVNGMPLYRDDDHLSRAGAALLSEEILKAIDTIPLETDG